jgi:hypothetical protein
MHFHCLTLTFIFTSYPAIANTVPLSMGCVSGKRFTTDWTIDYNLTGMIYQFRKIGRTKRETVSRFPRHVEDRATVVIHFIFSCWL